MALNKKALSLSFGFITVVGLASSWLSSCAQSEAATAAATTNDELLVVLNQSVQDIHTQVTDSSVDGTVAFKLNQIQSTLTGQGASGAQSNNNVLGLISKLSDDIGLMSERIGSMADRIVETEKLIVSVIAMQTDAATGVIASAKDSSGAALLPNLPTPIPNVFDEILRVSANGGANAPLLAFGANNAPSATLPPDIKIGGSNNGSYAFLVSDNPRFVVGYFNQIVDINAPTGSSRALDSVWQQAVQSFSINGTPPTKLYVAVKNIDANNTLSGISNSLQVTL